MRRSTKLDPGHWEPGAGSLQLPAVESSRCRSCNKCIEACPSKAIIEPLNICCSKCIKYCLTMDVPCSPEHIAFDYERCDSCGLCISSCPHQAIYWFIPEIRKDRSAK